MMKKILLLITILMLTLNAKADGNITYNRLIKAIAYVESTHNPKAVSEDGKHIGYLQISKSCVNECNRLIGQKKYTYNDRYDKDKSIEMFLIIQNYYNPSQDIHLAMRIWNEGISAIYKKHCLTKYMKKVLKKYQEYNHIDE